MANKAGKYIFGKPKKEETSATQRHRSHSRGIRERGAGNNNKPKPPAPPASPGNGGGGGGGGGGGSSGNPSKPYAAYYTRYLNISANMTLVNLAVREKMTMQDFALLVQRRDTERFLRTWRGQEVADNWREMYARIFPSLGAQPSIKSLRVWLKQEPAKGYRSVTNPTSMRAMYVWASKTKLFHQLYPDFDKTLYAQTLDFAGYQRERSSFKQILSSYLGHEASQDEISFFFKSRVSSADFEKNLQTMISGRESYGYATGEAIGRTEEKNALYGRGGSAATLAKIAAAYRTQGQFAASRPTEYLTQFEQATGRVRTQMAY